MNTLRVSKAIERLEQHGIKQMLITDPYAIFYFTGKMIHPGERFLGLYLNKKGTHRLFVNRLFTVPEDLGVEKVWFDDTEDIISNIAACIERDSTLGVDKNMAARFLLPIMEQAGASSYVNASVYIDEVRGCKDEEEQELMRTASKINDAAIERLKDCIKEGMTEEELSSKLLAIYKDLGAEDYSFGPLVGFGPNAAIGHYEGSGSVLKKGDCVLIDIGCKKDGYCSDMTRTFFFGEVSDRHRELYQIVKKAQEAAEAMIKPGVRFCDIDKTARDIIMEAGYGEYFTHRLGHSIGIEVHEYGDVSKVNEGIVKEGMIFSIEPGIYLEGDVGIRIEDLVLVTKDGVELLNHYTKELQVIEA